MDETIFAELATKCVHRYAAKTLNLTLLRAEYLSREYQFSQFQNLDRNSHSQDLNAPRPEN